MTRREGPGAVLEHDARCVAGATDVFDFWRNQTFLSIRIQPCLSKVFPSKISEIPT
jgi:hypothetical protein